jgi:glutamate-1-semialdehyde 2,1-aminomutase
MERAYKKSEKHYRRALQLMPAGVSSNSRMRSPHPVYFKSADGALLYDIDGNRYIDLNLGNGAVILGHNHPAVSKAVEAAVSSGLSIGVENNLTSQLAEEFLSAVPSMDLVRFTNTGSEATLHALHIARFATGKEKIAKPEGSYHGWVDEIFASAFHDVSKAGSLDRIETVPSTAGLHKSAIADICVFPFNDRERTRKVLEDNAENLAAVVLEPVMIDIGFIPAQKAYLEEIREICSRRNILLIFDEVLTSFRLAPGGAQEYYGVTPDLAIYGKAMANGYPLAAIAGLEKYLRLTEPGKGPTFVGTFNGHVVPVAAAIGTMPFLKDSATQKTLNMRIERLKKSFSASAAAAGVSAKLCGGGGHFHWYFTDSGVYDYRSAKKTNAGLYNAFASSLFDQGILVSGGAISHHAISLAHDDEILEELESCFHKALEFAAASVRS